MNDQSLRVLMVEDSESDELLIIRELKEGGYAPVYERVETAAEMKKALKEKQWDIILCDHKMPKFSAPSAIALLKKENIDIPIIIVSGAIGEEQPIECMHLGARDYIMKNNMSRLCPVIDRELKENDIKEKLSFEEQRFRIFADQSSDIIVLLNREGIITYENPAVEIILGFKVEEMIGTTGFEHIHPDDVKLVTDTYNMLSSDINAPAQRADIRFRNKDGSWRTFEGVASNLIHNNIIEAIIVNLRDITERKRIDGVLRESEERFRSVVEKSSVGIAIVDDAFMCTYVNKECCNISGYSEQELIGINFTSLLAEESKKLATERYLSRQRGEDVPSQYEFIFVQKNGAKRTGEVRSAVYFDSSGKAKSLIQVIDITERKKAEDLIRESEEKYRTILEEMEDVYFEVDIKGNITFVNSSSCKMSGYSDEELICMSFEKISVPDGIEKIRKYFGEIFLTDKTGKPFLWNLMKKSGDQGFFEIIVSLIRNKQGKPIGFRGIGRDITERKQMEASLRDSEENFRRSLDDSPLGVRISTIEGETIYTNRSMLEIYGYDSIEELKNTPLKERYTPESYAEFQLRKEKRLQGEFGPSEYKISIVRKNGEIRHLHVFRKEIFWNGEIQSQVIYQDITESKRAEEIIRESEEKYRMLFDDAQDGIALADAETSLLVDCNHALCRMVERNKQELVGQSQNILHPPEDLIEGVSPTFRKHQIDNPGLVLEDRLMTRGGRLVPVEIRAAKIRINNRNFLLGIFRDITERKQAEESALNAEKSLKKSEERYRSVFENAGLPIVIMENSLLIFMVNERFVEISGYGKDEIEGLMKFTDFIVSVDRDALMKCFSRRKGDKPVEYECQVAHRNGKRFDVLIRLGRIPGTDQFIASFTDITSRKQAEIVLLENQAHLQKENIRLRSSIRERYRFCDIIGKSNVMQEVYEFILQAAATQANVIIYGESGTGKELVAKAIHETSDRNRKSFVTVHCGAIPETLMESEFFGYKKGAFTGANLDKRGYLDEADNGTLFLDEVGEIGLNMQVKLLRAISGDGYTPVGSNTIKNSDVRIIAATNRNLRDLVNRGVMREDLFYRIHILPIYIPPLRERKDDLPLLIDYFLQLHDKNHPQLPGNIAAALLNYDWPGNIRELQNVLHRYLIFKKLDIDGKPIATTKWIEGESTESGNSIITNFVSSTLPSGQVQPAKNHDDMYVENSTITLEINERDRIMSALSKHNWRRDLTASALGINRKTLFRKMKKFGLIHP